MNLLINYYNCMHFYTEIIHCKISACFSCEAKNSFCFVVSVVNVNVLASMSVFFAL